MAEWLKASICYVDIFSNEYRGFESHPKETVETKGFIKMFGYFLLSTEIYIIIQVIFLLFFGIILQENILNLKYKFNVLKTMQFFTCLVLIYSMFVLYKTMDYEAILLNYQLINDNLSFFLKFMILLLSLMCILFS